MRMEAKTHARIAARSNKTDRYDDVSLKAVAGITRQLFSAEQEHRFDESGFSGHQPCLRFVRRRPKPDMARYVRVDKLRVADQPRTTARLTRFCRSNICLRNLFRREEAIDVVIANGDDPLRVGPKRRTMDRVGVAFNFAVT